MKYIHFMSKAHSLFNQRTKKDNLFIGKSLQNGSALLYLFLGLVKISFQAK